MKSMRNNTYTQIHIQLVFAVQNRQSMIYGISMGIACLIYGNPMGRKLHLRDVTDFDAVALVYNLCRYEQVMRPKMN